MKIAIIGAGVAGLVAALRLREANLDAVQEIVVMEKQPVPGGLLQSTNKGNYWWDNGAFVFTPNNYLVKLLPHMFKRVEDRSVKVWHKGKLHNYPFGIRNYLMSQSTFVLSKDIIDYISSNRKLYFGTNPSNLHEWLRYRTTDKFITETGLETYLIKLQGKSADELSPILGDQRLHFIHNATRPMRLIKSLFKRTHDSRTFMYPHGYGVGSISSELAKLCINRGIKIMYGINIEKIERNASTCRIFYRKKSNSYCHEASYIISTAPLNELVNILSPLPTQQILSCAKSLSFMDMQVVFFIVRRHSIPNKSLTIYSHERRHCWKRLLARSLQDGATSVLVEVTIDPRIGEPEYPIIDRVSNDLITDLRLFKRDDILSKHTAVVHKAYPIYDIGFEEKVATLIQEIESDNFLTAGRQGRYFYAGTDRVIQTAISAADKIINTISARTYTA